MATLLEDPSRSHLAQTLENEAWALLNRVVTANSDDSPEILDRTITLFQQANDLTPDDHQHKLNLLSALGFVLFRRFQRLNKPDDLDQYIGSYHRVVKLAPEGYPDLVSRLTNLGCGLHHRFQRFGDLEDLERAIASHRRAVEHCPEGSHVMPMLVSNLGAAFNDRFDLLDEPDDLQKAISLKRRAVELSQEDHPELPTFLDNLGIALNGRFERFGDLSDLEQAVSSHRRAIELCPEGHHHMPKRFSNFATALRNRFVRFSNHSDLEQAISSYRRAVESTPEEHPDLPTLLHNLSFALHGRFELFAELDDLDQAILLQYRAIKLTPKLHPDLSKRLSDLAIALRSRFRHLSDIADLEEAISLYRRAIGLSHERHSDMRTYLNNLGASLSDRFERLGELDDLEDAISSHHRAIELAPENHSSLPFHLNHLAIALHSRFEQLGEINDLEQAISFHGRTLALAPDGHTDLPLCFGNLGATLHRRFERLGELADLEKAISFHRSAIRLVPNDHTHLPTHLSNLGIALHSRFAQLGEHDDSVHAIESHRRAVDLTREGHTHLPARLSNLGNALYDRFERFGGPVDFDHALSSHRRAVELTPRGHSNLPKRLSRLGGTLRNRFERLGNEEDMIEARNCYKRAGDEQSGPPLLRLRAIAECASLLRVQSKACDTEGHALLSIYETAFALIPQAAWLGNSIGRRYEQLGEIGELIHGAAAAAINSGDLPRAVEWLDQGRAIVWGQLLQLRNPLDELYQHAPNLADRLQSISRALDTSAHSIDATFIGLSISTEPSQSKSTAYDEASTRIRLAQNYQSLLEEVRRLEGFHDFLLPKKLVHLARASTDGPIVIINVFSARCDALVVCDSPDQIIHVPLPELSYELVKRIGSQFIHVLGNSGVRERAPVDNLSGENRDRDGRGVAYRFKNLDPEAKLANILRWLWTTVVFPVLQAIEVKHHDPTSDELPHVTWCPTGPLAFLPLHAAGDYKSQDGSLKAFNRAVSSYTTSLSALLHPAPPGYPPDLRSSKLLVVSQPETPSCSALPGCLDEAIKLKNHFPEDAVIHLNHADATVEAVQQELTNGHCQIVHFACHGLQDNRDPTKSAFALYDGKLELSRLMSASTPGGALAFLSACQTATGDSKLPEEAVHLTAGILSAGYRAVIGTMWSVRDQDAPLIADEVYRYLKTDQACHKSGTRRLRIAHALHEAAKTLRDTVGEASVLRWAPFVHFGQ